MVPNRRAPAVSLLVMLPADQLELALDIHARSYRLLKWVAEAVRKGFIPATRAHEYADAADSARDWLAEHRLNLPADARPDESHLIEFANYFATYVTTSFDIVEQPGKKLISSCGCYCPMCSHLVNAPHLQVKQPTHRDKQRARRLMADRLQQLAIEHSLHVTRARAETIAGAPTTRCAAGYSAYGHWLIKRLSGITDGPAVLVLWREIAWTRAGAPIPRFELRQADFVAGEESLVRALREDN
jgi:hypothetical protein